MWFLGDSTLLLPCTLLCAGSHRGAGAQNGATIEVGITSLNMVGRTCTSQHSVTVAPLCERSVPVSPESARGVIETVTAYKYLHLLLSSGSTYVGTRHSVRAFELRGCLWTRAPSVCQGRWRAVSTRADRRLRRPAPSSAPYDWSFGPWASATRASTEVTTHAAP